MLQSWPNLTQWIVYCCLTQAGTLRWMNWSCWRKSRPGERWRRRGWGWRSTPGRGSRWSEDLPEVRGGHELLCCSGENNRPDGSSGERSVLDSIVSFCGFLCRVEVAAAGLEGRREELGGELYPGPSFLRVGSGDGAVSEKASACVRPPGHHCGHPGLGLVFS